MSDDYLRALAKQLWDAVYKIANPRCPRHRNGGQRRMTLVLVSCVPDLTRIIWLRWNVSPIKRVQDDVYLMLVAIKHDASAAYVAVHLNVQHHRRRDYLLLGSNYVRRPTKINVLRDHLTSPSFRADGILRGDLLQCQLAEIEHA